MIIVTCGLIITSVIFIRGSIKLAYRGSIKLAYSEKLYSVLWVNNDIFSLYVVGNDLALLNLPLQDLVQPT